MDSKFLFFLPKTGMAGDMVISALFHVLLQQEGQSFARKVTYLSDVLSSRGKINLEILDSRGIRLNTTDALGHELLGSQARQYLDEINESLNLEPTYADLSRKILNILTEAEFIVHSQNVITNPRTWNPNFISFKKIMKNSKKTVRMTFSSPNAEKNFRQIIVEAHDDALSHVHLHEASDILIDASLVAWCLQELDINLESEIFLIPPVMVGGGTIKFSHGQFRVPAPATKYILDVYNIPHSRGPIQRELVTPTGAAIIAALSPRVISDQEFEELSKEKKHVIGKGFGHAKLDRENALTCYYLTD